MKVAGLAVLLPKARGFFTRITAGGPPDFGGGSHFPYCSKKKTIKVSHFYNDPMYYKNHR
jgi:hypothetical protein